MSFKLIREISEEKFAEKEYKAELKKSEKLDHSILNELKLLLQQQKENSKIEIKAGESKLKPIYETSQDHYKTAIQYHKLKNIPLSLVYYELAQIKYSYYQKIKRGFKK